MTYFRRKLITPPALEPVTLDEFKEHARIDLTEENELIVRQLKAARQTAEDFTRLKLIAQTWDLIADDVTATVVKLPLLPLIQVTGVYVTDSTGAESAVNTAKYQVDLGDRQNSGRLILLTSPWGTQREFSSFRVRVVAGFGSVVGGDVVSTADDVPEALRSAIMSLAAYYFENREGQGPEIKYAGMATDQGIPQGVRDEMFPYRVIRL